MLSRRQQQQQQHSYSSSSSSSPSRTILPLQQQQQLQQQRDSDDGDDCDRGGSNGNGGVRSTALLATAPTTTDDGDGAFVGEKKSRRRKNLTYRFSFLASSELLTRIRLLLLRLLSTWSSMMPGRWSGRDDVDDDGKNCKRKENKERWKSTTSSTLLHLAGWLVLLALLILTFSNRPSKTARRPGRRGKLAAVPAATVNASVVLMNHNRPRMVRDSALLRTLVEHPAVTEVLLCHSNPRTKFRYDHPKVRNVDAVEANREMGLSLRFHYCRQASNDAVVHVDDDQELTPKSVDALLREFARDPRRIVGKYGRSYNFWTSPHRYGYDTATISGDVEVVLTKLLVLQRSVCDAFFRYKHLVEDDLVRPFSRPLWNGEDIFINLVANRVYGVPFDGPYNNYAFGGTATASSNADNNGVDGEDDSSSPDLDVWEAPDTYKDDDTGEHDVSGNMDRHRPWNVGLANWWRAYVRSQQHAAYRGRLWYEAKRRLYGTPVQLQVSTETV